MSSQPNHYQLLQLPRTASAGELRQAFRLLSKLYHPDTTALPASEAAEGFRRLRQAYAVLSDPLQRRAYDAELAAASPPARSPAPVAPPPLTVAPRADTVRRALSGGEWFALLLLAVALVISLVLGVGLAWMRGAELVRWPSWWPPPVPPAAVAPAADPVTDPSSDPGANPPPADGFPAA